MAEPWLEDARHQAAWDARMASRPRCLDCKKPIGDEMCLPMEGGFLCQRCLHWRMVEVDDIAC